MIWWTRMFDSVNPFVSNPWPVTWPGHLCRVRGGDRPLVAARHPNRAITPATGFQAR